MDTTFSIIRPSPINNNSTSFGNHDKHKIIQKITHYNSFQIVLFDRSDRDSAHLEGSRDSNHNFWCFNPTPGMNIKVAVDSMYSCIPPSNLNPLFSPVELVSS